MAVQHFTHGGGFMDWISSQLLNDAPTMPTDDAPFEDWLDRARGLSVEDLLDELSAVEEVHPTAGPGKPFGPPMPWPLMFREDAAWAELFDRLGLGPVYDQWSPPPGYTEVDLPKRQMVEELMQLVPA